MKSLKSSSKGLRRALGFGLLGLMLSVVPTGQAGATVTISDLNPSDGFVLGSNPTVGAADNSITVIETISETTHAPISYLVSTYPEEGIITQNGTYFDKVVSFTNAVNAPVTWTWKITNNTGHAWTDYHFEFWDPTFTTRLTGLTLIGSSSDQLGNYTFLTEPVGYGSDPSQKGTVLSYYDATPGEVHADGVTGTYTMTGNLMSISKGATSGSFGMRQIATIPVPEPGTLSLLGIGLTGLMGFRKYKRA